MVNVENIRKVYKLSRKQMVKEKIKSNKKIAVEKVSFQAKPGEIYGLLGPNGAGKTTCLRCIATLIKADKGTINVLGYDVNKQSEDVRRNICFLTNELKLDPNFTADYTATYFGQLYNMTKEEIDYRKKLLFNEFGIEEFKDVKISEMSTGMKQKMSVVVNLLHDPSVIIFDEPTNGLDVITARTVTDYLEKLKTEGKTVIISTHIMVVAQKLCDKIGILIGGNLVAEGSLDEILVMTGEKDLDDAFFNLYKKEKGDQII